MPADLYGYLYAATVAAGGIIGYVKAGKQTLIFWQFKKSIAINFFLQIISRFYSITWSWFSFWIHSR